MTLREQVLDDMPIEYRDRFAELLGRTSVPARKLVGDLDEYMAAVRRLAALTHLDLAPVQRLCEVLRAHLAAHEALDPDRRGLVQAAVEYFVTEDDDDEVTGVLAFDDDVQVVNAVSRALARPDLVIPFTPAPPPADG